MDENFQIPPRALKVPLLPEVEEGAAVSNQPPQKKSSRRILPKKKKVATEPQRPEPTTNTLLYGADGKLSPTPTGKFIDLNAG
ncbi:MAG: hypothetical protein AB7S81_02045 [Bdellovibrionales bacterium]